MAESAILEMGRLPHRAHTAYHPRDLEFFAPLDARSSHGSVFAGVMDVCPICFDLGDVVVLLQCGHSFCEPCYVRSGSPLKCMTCRQETANGRAERHMLPAALRSMQTTFEAENQALSRLVPQRGEDEGDGGIRMGTATSAECTYVLLEVPAAPHEESAPLLTLLLDVSGSMGSMWPAFCELFGGVVERHVGAYVAVAVFSDAPRTVVEPCLVTEENAASLVASVKAVHVTGSTMLSSALAHADALATRLETLSAGTARVVCVTDGQASDETQVRAALRRMEHEVLFRGIGEGHNFDFCAENGATRYAHFPTVATLAEALGERVSVRSLTVECEEGASVFYDGRVEPCVGLFRCSLPSDAATLIGFKGPVRLDTLAVSGAAQRAKARPVLSLGVGRFLSQVHALKYITDLSFNIDDHDVTMHIGLLKRTRVFLRAQGPHTTGLVDLVDARLPGLVGRMRAGCEIGLTINAGAGAVSWTARHLSLQP